MLIDEGRECLFDIVKGIKEQIDPYIDLIDETLELDIDNGVFDSLFIEAMDELNNLLNDIEDSLYDAKGWNKSSLEDLKEDVEDVISILENIKSGDLNYICEDLYKKLEVKVIKSKSTLSDEEVIKVTMLKEMLKEMDKTLSDNEAWKLAFDQYKNKK